MNDFIEHGYPSIGSPMFQRSQTKTFLHLGHTVICWVIVLDQPDSSTLNPLDLADISLGVRTPYSGGILYLRSYWSKSCRHIAWCIGNFKIFVWLFSIIHIFWAFLYYIEEKPKNIFKNTYDLMYSCLTISAALKIEFIRYSVSARPWILRFHYQNGEQIQQRFSARMVSKDHRISWWTCGSFCQMTFLWQSLKMAVIFLHQQLNGYNFREILTIAIKSISKCSY